MAKPVAVLISDVHYSLNTLELADSAFRQAIDKARYLNVPLIDCGDLTNDKAILRAEVVNRLINTMVYARACKVDVYLIVGNHSLCNEKGDEHALEFLKPFVSKVVSGPSGIPEVGYLVPYYSDSARLKHLLSNYPKGTTIIMHQGVMGAEMGHYVQDKTSLPPETFADFRVISGHYHRRQDIKTGPARKGGVGLFSYVGNPYTLSFGEADDPSKGYQILMDDGSLEFEPTNLRKHVVLDWYLETLSYWEHTDKPLPEIDSNDLLWVKLSGTTSELQKIKKEDVAKVFGHSNFKLDKIYQDRVSLKEEHKTDKMTGEQVLDAVIDAETDSDEHKAYLKKLWREII